MDEMRFVAPVRQVELERLAGEAVAEEGLEGRPGFFAHYLQDAFADHLLGRKVPTFCVVPIDELVAGFRVAVCDSDRGVVGDKAQLALAVVRRSVEVLPSACRPRQGFRSAPAGPPLPRRFWREPLGRPSAR
jgi:hypothetical protein